MSQQKKSSQLLRKQIDEAVDSMNEEADTFNEVYASYQYELFKAKNE